MTLEGPSQLESMQSANNPSVSIMLLPRKYLIMPLKDANGPVHHWSEQDDNGLEETQGRRTSIALCSKKSAGGPVVFATTVFDRTIRRKSIIIIIMGRKLSGLSYKFLPRVNVRHTRQPPIRSQVALRGDHPIN